MSRIDEQESVNGYCSTKKFENFGRSEGEITRIVQPLKEASTVSGKAHDSGYEGRTSYDASKTGLVGEDRATQGGFFSSKSESAQALFTNPNGFEDFGRSQKTEYPVYHTRLARKSRLRNPL
jgi:hypothetical protein